ncbi:copper-transporting P-type ATPase, putative [Bodo saltans]|uniref:Copper-transporting P-type ATPase, putative n=1 Tax=Bodo saltans TaxID=75058 RepID=A0A0S4J742_BODSA|nr:copper-transporting P-type ATPase, putative [Bodo saltans]|eukprot:CUG86258.1 copper-transporting P-type ATPase, putative [Bodo saltans]
MQPVVVTTMIEGMSCGSCAARVEKELRGSLDSALKMSEVAVNFATKQCRVDFAPTTDPESAKSAVRSVIVSLGYEVIAPSVAGGARKTPAMQPVVVTTMIEGMSCGSCAARVEKELRGSLDPVLKMSEVAVNFATKQCRIDFAPTTNPESAKSAVRSVIVSLGYEVIAPSVAGGSIDAIERSGDVSCWRSVTLRIEGQLEATRASRLEAALRQRITEHTDGSTVDAVVVDSSSSLCVLRFHDAGVSWRVALRIANVVVIAVEAAAGTHLRAELQGAESSQSNITFDNDGVDQTRKALERTREIRVQWQMFIGSLLFTVPLDSMMIIDMAASSVDNGVHRDQGLWLHVAEFIAATPVVLYFGRQFFEKAWVGLKHKSFTMDTLVAIGVGSAYLFSLISLILFWASDDVLTVYFDAAATLTTFMLLGRFLEANAKRHTSGALIQLMSLVPPVATVAVEEEGELVDKLDKGEDGGKKFLRVPSALLMAGMKCRVLAADRIPVDGVVVAGSTEIDEQLVTGESVPRVVICGDAVTGGSLNLTHTTVIEATRVGEDTTLSNILRIVQDAQSSKPAIQRVADAIAGVFVPCVVSFALVVLVVWVVVGELDAYPSEWRSGQSSFVFAFGYFVATVVVACPCALGLAAPTAVMVGTGVGATNGVLIKSGALLEVASSVTCVVFDKTGTLTKGALQVVSSIVADTVEPDVARLAVAAVEELSRHPIAKAIHKYISSALPSSANIAYEVSDCETHPGHGVTATVLLRPHGAAERLVHVAVGSLAMMETAASATHDERRRHAVSTQLVDFVRAQHSEGRTTVVASIDGVACIAFGLEDGLKDEARSVVGYLQRKNVRVLMVTGDHADVASHMAREAGIQDPTSNVHAGVLPQSKATIVKELQADGYRVAFVGDGIKSTTTLLTLC